MSVPSRCFSEPGCSSADVDEHGWPRAPLEGEDSLPEEVLLEQAAKREAAIRAVQGPEGLAPLPPLSRTPLQGHMSQEEFDAFDYPQTPAEWTEEWMRKQIELERVDPRVNPNLLLDETQQEFWNNISRKPYAKAILRAEEHWKDRRRVWLQQYERVEIMNQVREELAEELEGCAPEMKRLLAPIMVH
ncbi:unnamed protein product, partial [Polarella glacialis]